MLPFSGCQELEVRDTDSHDQGHPARTYFQIVQVVRSRGWLTGMTVIALTIRRTSVSQWMVQLGMECLAALMQTK